MSGSETLLSIAASETDSNQYYATRMLIPDPFIFLKHTGQTIIVLSDLEIERGRVEAQVNEILALSVYRDRLQEQGNEFPKLIEIAARVLQDYGITAVVVPGNFALEYADALRARGFCVTPREPFWETRMRKTLPEIDAIQAVQRHNESAMDRVEQILREAVIGDRDQLVYRGQVLTSEYVQRQIQRTLLELDCLAQHTIVTCGEQATRPHEHGSGPLSAHQTIIVDIFPQSLTSRYFADMTRTFVKGRASTDMRLMYATVKAGQELALAAIRAGANGQAIHRQVQELFTQNGFNTGVIDGTVQGFFHGTGHGLGIEIHEPPRIGNVDATLHAGNVVTVEPGLYYLKIGGVRLEDLVVVTENGCRNLTTYPKELEIP